MRDVPIVEYAQQIGKNTAEFTVTDMCNFSKWWMKQQPRKDLTNMAKKHNVAAFQNAQMSRLPVTALEQELDDKQEEMIAESDAIVCEVGFTQEDIDAVVWGLNELLTTYDFEGNDMGERLQGLYDNLEGLATKGE